MSRSLRLSFIVAFWWIGAAKPQKGDASDLVGDKQLPILSPIQGPVKPLAPELTFLLWGAVRRRACVERLPHQLLIDHAYGRPIRLDRLLHAILSQDRLEHAL